MPELEVDNPMVRHLARVERRWDSYQAIVGNIWWWYCLTTLLLIPILEVGLLWRTGDWGRTLPMAGPSPWNLELLGIWWVWTDPWRMMWACALMIFLTYALAVTHPFGKGRGQEIAGVGLGISVIVAGSLVGGAIAHIMGIRVTSPDFAAIPGGQLWLLLMNAGFWEEIVGRVILIGVPLVLWRRITWSERCHALMFGPDRKGFTRDGIVLVVLASVAFGLLHLPGYGAWKVPPTIFAGLMLGIAYLRFGLIMPVLIHSMIDVSVAHELVLQDTSFEIVGHLVVITILLLMVITLPIIHHWTKRNMGAQND